MLSPAGNRGEIHIIYLGENEMTDEEKRKALTSLLRELPDVLVPMQIARILHQSKNLIYEKLKKERSRITQSTESA